jgi:hypothetical protein
MKNSHFLPLLVGASVALLAAAAPPGTISRPGAQPAISSGQANPGELTFTNESGQPFTSAEMVEEIRILQTNVDRLLPMLTAFNAHYGAGASAQGPGGLAGILGRILNRDTNSPSASGTGGSTLSNVLAGIGAALNTNNTQQAQVPISPEGLRQLQTLQTQLQPVQPILQALNGNRGTSPPAGVIGRYPAQNGGLTPTGR